MEPSIAILLLLPPSVETDLRWYYIDGLFLIHVKYYRTATFFVTKYCVFVDVTVL